MTVTDALAAAFAAVMAAAFAAVTAIAPAAVFAADPFGGDRAPSEASLIVDTASAQSGRPFTVGLRLKLAQDWHTYWRNPGDSGMATVIDWQLPPGFTAGPILWPPPQRFSEGELTTYGYAGEVVLLTEITPPPDLVAGAPFTITADAHWLVCREICIPESAVLTQAISEPPRSPAQDAAAAKKALAQARAALPVASHWPARYRADGETLRLAIDSGGSLRGEAVEAWFYPDDGLVISHGAPQRARLAAGVLSIEVAAGVALPPPAVPLTGVLVLRAPGHEGALEIQAYPTDPASGG